MNSQRNQKKIFTRIGLIICVLAVFWGSAEVVEAKPSAGGFDCATDQTTISTADCLILDTIFNATGGPAWTYKTNWYGNTDPCTWYGITCGTGTPRPITLINLNNNNLVGGIPENLGMLTSLTYLDLASNTLTGAIPLELGNITSLNGLVLSYNSLVGHLPAELGNLTNLDNLEIASNFFYGKLPQSLINLPLTTLRFAGTLLCEPQNVAFQSWFTSVLSVIGTGIHCEHFMDDFETGDFSLWTRFNDGKGYLYPCHAAAINGIWGACVDRGTDKRKQLIDETPVNQTVFNVRFNLDINSLSMPPGTRFRFMQVKMGAERPFFIVLKYQGGQYLIQLNALMDDRTKLKTAWYPLSNASHTIEVDWLAATQDGANNGTAALYLDDALQAMLMWLDNDTIYVDTFKIGFTSRLDGKPISGIFYLDDIATSNLYHIGLP